MTRRKPPAPLAPLPTGLGAIAAIEPGNMSQMNLANLAAVAGQFMQLLDRDHEHCVAFAAGLPWEKAHAKTEARIKAQAQREAAEIGAKAEQAARAAKDANERFGTAA